MDNGTYKDVLSVHDWKYADFGDEGLIPMEIAGFELDEVYDERLYPGPVTNVSYEATVCGFNIKYQDPDDENWLGTLILARLNSSIPANNASSPDTYVISNSTIRNQYKDSSFYAGLSLSNKIHSISIITYSKYGYNLNDYYYFSDKYYLDGFSGPIDTVAFPEFDKVVAPITWIGKILLNTPIVYGQDEHCFYRPNEKYNYEISYIKGYCENEVFNLLQNSKDNPCSYIQPVLKYTDRQTGDRPFNYEEIFWIGDKTEEELYVLNNIWIPSAKEIGVENSEPHGFTYSNIFNNNNGSWEDSRDRTTVDYIEDYFDYNRSYWLRSGAASEYEVYRMVYNVESGVPVSCDINMGKNVLPCFCTGGHKPTWTVRFINASSGEDVVLEEYQVEDGGSVQYKGEEPFYRESRDYQFYKWIKEKNYQDKAFSQTGYLLHETITVKENSDLYASFEYGGGGN